MSTDDQKILSKEQIDIVISLYSRGDYHEAITQIKELNKKYPNVPLLFNIIGACYKSLGKLNHAVKMFESAVNLKSDYVEAYKNLGITFKDLNRLNDAVKSFEKAIEIDSNNAVLHFYLANIFEELEQFENSIIHHQIAIEINPKFYESFNNLGNVFNRHKKIDDAIKNYQNAIEINPNFPEAYNNLGNIYKDLGQMDVAIENYEWAIAYKHDFFQAHNNLGIAQSESNQLELAIKSFQNAIRISPNFIDAHFNLGIALNETGKQKKAIHSFEKVLDINPSHYESYRNLSIIKDFKDRDPQTKFMESLLRKNELKESEKIDLNFALASVYENLNNMEKQFKFLSKGNQLRKKQLNYSITNDKKRFSALKKVFKTRPLPLKINKDSKPNMRPIFIVGMPRSGTSLVEQILASHKEVFGAGELTIIGEYSISFMSKIVLSGSVKITDKNLQEMRNYYFSTLRNLDFSESIITDKMPLNFEYIGFILAAIPEAKIIHLKRDARATCWSIYKYYFGERGNGYAYNMSDLALFYELYHNLMNFWHELYPNKIYDLNYENLTVNQEKETRKLLEYCDLEWDESCLNFHENDRAVKTVSSHQVRQKMYQGSSETWKDYKEYLRPLLKDLVIDS